MIEGTQCGNIYSFMDIYVMEMARQCSEMVHYVVQPQTMQF